MSIPLATAALSLLLGIPAVLAEAPGSTDRCVTVRISPDGTRTVIDDPDEVAAYVDGRTAGATASARSSGTASSRSSVSLSSSSSSSSDRGGRATATSTVSNDRGTRTVTTTEDENGCTTVVDERPASRSDR